MTFSVLSEDQLFRQVPQLFSTEGGEKVSDKYSVIPTIDVVRGLQKNGFLPVKAEGTRSRGACGMSFSKHMIRFRQAGALEVGGNVAEIVLVNSHDGTSSYQMRAGIYRFVCSNGLVVGNDLFYRKIRHQGDVISKVVESAGQIIDIIPEVMSKAEEWKGVNLNEGERRIFAESALKLKYDDPSIDVSPERALVPVRRADTLKSDLWTTFNILQEKLIRGGVRYLARDEMGRATRRGTTRAVNSVSENSRLNTALWTLTEKMAELVKR